MKWEPSDLAVGAVVMAAVLVLMGSLLWLSPALGTRAYPLYTEFDRIDGLARQGQVLLRGYNVGSVESIAPRLTEDGLRFRVRLSIHARLASGDSLFLPEGTVARLVPPPVIGAGIVVLQPPPGGGPNLPPGALIPGVRAEAVLEQMQGLTGDLSDEALTMMITARSLMDSVATAVGFTNRVLAETTGALPQLLVGLERQLVATEALTTNLHAHLDHLTPAVQASVDSAVLLMADSRRLIQGLQQTVDATTPEIEDILAHLDTTTLIFSHFVREVTRSPWRLFSGVRPPAGLGERDPETATPPRP